MCMYVYMSLCFIRTVRILKPRVKSVAQTDALILLMGLTVCGVFTFRQYILTFQY